MKDSIIAVFVLLLASASPALAQQQPPDPALLQRVLGSMQTQRNQAQDAAAVAEARAIGLADDLNKANARIKELETTPLPPDKK